MSPPAREATLLRSMLAYAIVLSCGTTAFASTLARAAGRFRRSPLRRCPLCASDAVRESRRETIPGLQFRVEQQCGQCGTWRRFTTTQFAARRQDRRFEADRRAIADRADRLEHDAMASDTRAFAAALRCDVTGAEDFLAATKPYGTSITGLEQ
jgi:hypothetical protein